MLVFGLRLLSHLPSSSYHQFVAANLLLITTFLFSETILVVTESVHGGSLESFLRCKGDGSNALFPSKSDRQMAPYISVGEGGRGRGKWAGGSGWLTIHMLLEWVVDNPHAFGVGG